MIGVQTVINASDLARLTYLATRFPRQTYRAIGRAGSAVRGKMRKAMRQGGGNDGVPTFKPISPETAVLRQRKLGGRLSEGSAIQMHKDGKAARVIGFISALAPFALAFQTSETRPMEPGERRLWYRFGYNPAPQTYVRPARDVVDSIAKKYEPEFLRWAIRNTEKILAKAKK